MDTLTTTGRRPRLLAALVLALTGCLLVVASPAVASPGTPPGTVAQETITYEVRTRGAVQADVDVFARVAQRTFNDRRGWSLGGSVLFRHVPSGGDFTLWLASPDEVADAAPICSAQWSCTVGRNVLINDERWRRGTSTWPDVREYRSYVLNHELGHWLGLDHRSCPQRGAYAPVMQQQSISLEGCTSNTWPIQDERRVAAQRQGVTLRSERPDLYAITQQGATGTEVHVLDGSRGFGGFVGHHSTALGATDAELWEFTVADRNADGVDDLIGIARDGASNSTEVHVLDGASGFRAFQLQTATALHPTRGDQWSFDHGDVNADGILDLLAFAHSGASGSTEVHVLDGASNYTRWLVHSATALHPVDAGRWVLQAGDHDRDGWVDVYAIARRGRSGQTEVHVLDGAAGWQRFSAHVATALHAVDESWDFEVDDFQGDGYTAVYGILRQGASGRTEVHVLDDFQYRSFLLHSATALHGTADQPHWRFGVD